MSMMRRVLFCLLFTFAAFCIGSMSVVLASFNNKNAHEETKLIKSDNSATTLTNSTYSLPQLMTVHTADTVGDNKDKKPFCKNPNWLPIWNAIRTDRESRARLDDAFDIQDCSQMFEVRHVDLNHDQRKEILVRGKTVPLCGGVGNCMFSVLEKHGNKLHILLTTTDYIDRSVMGRQILKSSTNGYADLLTTGHIVAGETSFDYWKFDGHKYKAKKSLYEVFDKEVNGKPTFKFVTSKKFVSRLDG